MSQRSLTAEMSRFFDHLYRRIVGISSTQFSRISPHLYLGGQYSKNGLSVLKWLGFTGIVSIRTKIEPGLFSRDEIEFLQLRIPDKNVPTAAQLNQFVTFIKKHKKSNGRVYVHCAVGEGRSPTLVTAYLMSTGLTLDESLHQIKSVRNFIRPTKVQMTFLERLNSNN